MSSIYLNAVSPWREDGGRKQLDTQFGYGFLLQDERFLLTPYLGFASGNSVRQRTQIGMHLQQVLRAIAKLSSRIGIGRVKTVRDQSELTFEAVMQVGF